MKLEKFNHYNTFLVFNPDSGQWSESEEGEKDIAGVGSYVTDRIVALFVERGELFLLLGDIKFNVNDPRLKFTYEHEQNSTTTFKVSNGISSFELNYPSWWKSNSAIAAYEGGDDEDEDICAYILFMLASENRRNHLLNKFS